MSRPLLALFLIAPAATVGTLAGVLLWPGTAMGQVVYAAAKLWLYGLPLVWFGYVERQRWSLSPVRKGGLGMGAALGAAIGVVILLAYALIGRSMMDVEAVRELGREVIGPISRFWLFAAYICLVNALLEEFAFRWFIHRQCERLMGPVSAVLLAAAIFTVHHVLALMAYFDWPLTLLCSLGVFIGGVTWSWLYHHYRSIWPCYLSHAIVDVAIFAVVWHLLYA